MNPVKGPIFQQFAAKWIADRDFVLNGRQVKKGDDIYKKFFNLNGHNGLDYQAALGEPIFAAFDGYIIEQVSRETGYGLKISHRFEIDGIPYIAIYGHMSRLEKDIDIPWNWVDKNYPVKEGQIIGYVGSTGDSSGPHLHFGVIPVDKNGGQLQPLNGYGGCIDPVPLITKGQKKMTPGFKTKTDPTVYVQIGINLVAIADWEAFVSIGGSELSVIVLEDTEFAKFNIVGSDIFKTK